MSHLPEQGSEAWLAYLWQARLLPEPLPTTDGGWVTVISPGLPNTDRGPDFLDALLLYNGAQLRQGDVELHLRSRDWEGHGHAGDPRYDRVVLHLVAATDPGRAPRCGAGEPIPEAVVPEELLVIAAAPLSGYQPRFAPPCAGLALTADHSTVAEGIHELGRRRFAERVACFHHELGEAPVDQVLYRALAEGLGYGRNQEAYRNLADRLPWDRLLTETGSVGANQAQRLSAALLTAASPEAAGRGIAWDRFRLLPAAQPEVRIRAFGRLLERLLPEGPARCCAAAILQGAGRPGALLALLTVGTEPGGGGLGRGRAVALAVNAVLPFLVAWAEATGHQQLAAQAAACFGNLPGSGGDRVTRWLEDRWDGRSARTAQHEQGQHHLYRGWCTSGACGRCPLLARLGRSASGEGQTGFHVQVPA